MEVPARPGPPGGRDGVPGPGQQAHHQGAGRRPGVAPHWAGLPRDEGQPHARDGDPGGDVGRQAGLRAEDRAGRGNV